MNLTDLSIIKLCNTIENQNFDRKSAKIEASKIATLMIAFANADGGLIAVGIEDNGTITGIDDFTSNINEILRAGFNFCQPSIIFEKEIIECVDFKGKNNHIILLKIKQSPELHVNNRDEVYLRVGDKSKKLTFNERMELTYAKGVFFFEDEGVFRSSFDDIDLNIVSRYCNKIGYKKTPQEYLKENKTFVVNVSNREEMSVAAILLFGKNPQKFFPRARVRFIKYEGNFEKNGTQMNVIKDIIFEGSILSLLEQTISFLKTQIKEHTFLGKNGRFVTEQEYPEFAWQEIIINAIAHRDYSIKGTDIQIKMFDDHLSVESPGILPGNVRINNIRNIHFSRNPKIAQYLHEYEYVREFGEGVDRLYKELNDASLPEPKYELSSFMLNVSIFNKKYVNTKKIFTNSINKITNSEVYSERNIDEFINESAEVDTKSAEVDAKSAEVDSKSAEVIKDYFNGLSKQEIIILNYLIENQEISSKNVMDLLNVKERRARLILSNMCNKNLLLRVGATKNLKYLRKIES